MIDILITLAVLTVVVLVARPRVEPKVFKGILIGAGAVAIVAILAKIGIL